MLFNFCFVGRSGEKFHAIWRQDVAVFLHVRRKDLGCVIWVFSRGWGAGLHVKVGGKRRDSVFRLVLGSRSGEVQMVFETARLGDFSKMVETFAKCFCQRIKMREQLLLMFTHLIAPLFDVLHVKPRQSWKS